MASPATRLRTLVIIICWYSVQAISKPFWLRRPGTPELANSVS
jgi:hypothetical protein